MRELIEGLVRQALLPHVDRLASVSDELNELHRRLGNVIRAGVLTAVDPASGRCQVRHGECLSPWIRYFMPAAGEVRQARHPSVGEQCLLLNYGGGDTSAQAMALCGLPCNGFPLVSTEGHVSATEYPDGLRLQHDSQHRITETRYSDGAFHQYDASAQRMTTQVATSSMVMDPTAITMSAGGAVLRLDAAGITLNGAAVTHSGVNIGNTHIHPNVQKGPAKTDPPEA